MSKERKALTIKQKIKFLKLIAQLSSNTTFERTLGFDSSDIEFYKKQLDVENQDDARRLYKNLEIESIEDREERAIDDTKKQRESEVVANARLKEFEQKRKTEQQEKIATMSKKDPNAIRSDDAERQRRFETEQETSIQEALSDSEPWSLLLDESDLDAKAKVDRFRKDIEYCGMTFCVNKYQVSAKQIKAEANKLGLKIRWDNIKR